MSRCFAIVLLLLCSPIAHSSTTDPEPGLYRVTVGISGQKLPAGEVEQSSEQCITQEDVATSSSGFVSDAIDLEGCPFTKDNWADDKIELEMVCSVEGVVTAATGRGTYNATGTN